ncbi:hypothetical protein GCWU000323_01095 [Leptotrichia hofstadii F0254]|uniref:Uncharacterized protein n=1 Tax=Leptotrichia hofstadii F0254 TaxID=634994 RepID=C9MX24_9FUSO|nr:hypothetical protein GCWU000323_01095 [Leptotrichia hofstadii F0254]
MANATAVLIRYFDTKTESSILGEIINLFWAELSARFYFRILLYSLLKPA